MDKYFDKLSHFRFKLQKITKRNVWSAHLIDHFQRAVENHHRSLGNFPLVGSVLEASSQIYGFRVDCVHNDIIRLSSGLHRENSMLMKSIELKEKI